MRPIDYLTDEEKFIYKRTMKELEIFTFNSIREIQSLEKTLDTLLTKAIERHIEKKATY